MTRHHVAVSTIRPELLETQLITFVDNFIRHAAPRGDELSLHVFVDQPEAHRDFPAVAQRMRWQHAGVPIEIWDHRRVAGVLPSGAPWFDDPVLGGRRGGIRCIQNIATYVLETRCARPGDLVHRVDDDVYPLALSLDRDVLRLDHRLDFFGERTAMFERADVRLVGAGVAGDSPSPIGDVYWSLRAAEHLLRHALAAAPGDDWSACAIDIPATCADEVDDPYGVLDTRPLPRRATFEQAFTRLVELLENLHAGRGRIAIETSAFFYDAQFGGAPWIAPRFTLPNCCVSQRAGDPVNPSFILGNPDTLTYCCEQLWRGGVWGGPPVLHLKGRSRRRSLFDVEVIAEKHDYNVTVAVLRALANELVPESRQRLLHYADHATRQLEGIVELAAAIGAHALGLAHRPSWRDGLAFVVDTAGDARAFAIAMKAEIARGAPDPTELIERYRRYADAWRSALRAHGRVPAELPVAVLGGVPA